MQARVQGMGPRGPEPPLLQLMVAFIHVLNNIDVVITIIYSQKYVLFEIMYSQISWNVKLNN